MSFTPDEMTKLKKHIESIFKCTGVSLKKREKASDSIEVLMDGEFLGLLYKDTEDGETSYDFNMSILDIDLKEAT